MLNNEWGEYVNMKLWDNRASNKITYLQFKFFF